MQTVMLCRSQRTLENRLALDDDKITLLEQQVKSLKVALGDMERKYEEVNTWLLCCCTVLNFSCITRPHCSSS